MVIVCIRIYSNGIPSGQNLRIMKIRGEAPCQSAPKVHRTPPQRSNGLLPKGMPLALEDALPKESPRESLGPSDWHGRKLSKSGIKNHVYH